MQILQKKNYVDNQDRLLDKQKFYNEENRNHKNEYQKIYNKQNQSKINLYRKNRKETDLNFKLACNIRSRTSEAFKAQNIRKINKAFDLLGCSPNFFKKWILIRFMVI